jgi:hypothetical protein
MILKLIAWFDPQFARRRKKGHFSLMSYIQYKLTHRKVKPTKLYITVFGDGYVDEIVDAKEFIRLQRRGKLYQF